MNAPACRGRIDANPTHFFALPERVPAGFFRSANQGES